jgi:hypothetical protein
MYSTRLLADAKMPKGMLQLPLMFASAVAIACGLNGGPPAPP